MQSIPKQFQIKRNLNPKLLQFSLELSYAQSKYIQSQHNQHLKKLEQIQNKSNIPKIMKQSKSLKNISESLYKYKHLSKNFKQKQLQYKRQNDDYKMIKSLSQIFKNKQRTYSSNAKEQRQLLNRKQKNTKLVQINKLKEIQNQNLKIAERIRKQGDSASSKHKMEKDIYEYIRLRRHMQKLKENQALNLFQNQKSRIKKSQRIFTQETQNINLKTNFEHLQSTNKNLKKCQTENCQEQSQFKSHEHSQSMKSQDIIKLLNKKRISNQNNNSKNKNKFGPQQTKKINQQKNDSQFIQEDIQKNIQLLIN